MSHYKLWKLEDLKKGIDRFYLENNRYPNHQDFDKSNYLPSSRWIQIKFGGLVAVRKKLGYQDIHFGHGEFRTMIAKRINQDGLDLEHKVEELLINRFGEHFVHIQKRIGKLRQRLDFFVYCMDENFGVDVTNVTGDFRNAETNINIKIGRYKDLKMPIFIVVASMFNQAKINRWLGRRTTFLPQNFKITTLPNFNKIIKMYRPLLIQLSNV